MAGSSERVGAGGLDLLGALAGGRGLQEFRVRLAQVLADQGLGPALGDRQVLAVVSGKLCWM
jgi:hypothetical protein